MAKVSPEHAHRLPATEGMRFANAVVALQGLPPASRIALRATDKGVKAFRRHLGFSLPAGPGQTAASQDARHAFWLGPDEWLIIDEGSPDKTLVPARANAEFSAIDVSHRNVAFSVSGEGAEAALNIACPRDLSLEAFPAGSASRTVFGKAEVLLYRHDDDTFRVECWRSFAPYVWKMLMAGARDAPF